MISESMRGPADHESTAFMRFSQSSFTLLVFLLSTFLLRSSLWLFLGLLLWFFLWSLFLCASTVKGAFDEGRDIVLVVFTCFSSLGALGLLANEILEEAVLLRTNLSQDVWHQVLELLGFISAGNDQNALMGRELNLWSFEMNNGIVILEHVHFLNLSKRLYAEFLDGSLKLFVFLGSFWLCLLNLLNPPLSALSAKLSVFAELCCESSTSLCYFLGSFWLC